VTAAAPDSPKWFVDALEDKPEHHEIMVSGAPIHYRVWGKPDLPGLVLVHGAGAHSGWWDHIAPYLSLHRVAALDLSGHGDSGHRPAYEVETWADEIAAVAAAQGMHRALVVGHSMGGRVAVTAGVRHPDTVAAVASIDTPLRHLYPEEANPHVRRTIGPVYPTLAAAVARFRTLPQQDQVLPYVREHVAQGSLRQVDGGYRWKFDPHIFKRRPTLHELLPQLSRPAAFLYCEHGLVDAATADEMAALVGGPAVVAGIPDAGHHPMLDQPLLLVSALRTLLALWPPRAFCASATG
jgi:pimeloyl-ACP methyl ester carboxylesterase